MSFDRQLRVLPALKLIVHVPISTCSSASSNRFTELMKCFHLSQSSDSQDSRGTNVKASIDTHDGGDMG
jgi:hypothetical protein